VKSVLLSRLREPDKDVGPRKYGNMLWARIRAVEVDFKNLGF